jgi:hypothetical protein
LPAVWPAFFLFRVRTGGRAERTRGRARREARDSDRVPRLPLTPAFPASMIPSMDTSMSNFDFLASQIPEDERKALFSRITESIQYSTIPFHEGEDETVEGGNIEEAYHKKGAWEHFVCALLGFFKRRKPLEVFQDRLLRGLKGRIAAEAPGVVDMRQGSLAQGFLDKLEELKDASRFFYATLDSSIEKERGEFIAFMGSTYMADIDRRLVRDCDAYAVGEANQLSDDQAVLRLCLESMDSILSSISEDRKKAMYRQFRTLFCLKKLASYPFDRFISSFDSDPAGRKACPIALASSLMAELADVFASLYEPPPEDLLELMFLFPIQRLFADDRAALEASLEESMKKANTAVAVIRSFMAEVPIVDLIKCARKDLSYAPKQLSGGEDWFGQYKAFWRAKAEARHSSYTRDKRRMRLEREVTEFLGGRPIPGREKAGSAVDGESLSVRHEYLFSFISAAFETTFAEEVNRPLKILLIDGLFFRQENRLEYADACNEFMKMPELIRGFESRLARDGDLGRLFDEARLDFGGTGSKQNRMLAAIQAASADADKILFGFIRSVRTLLAIIGAINKPDSSSHYESLQNLSTIDGRMNSQYRHSLERTHDIFELFLGLVGQICELDSIKLDI